MVFLDGMLYSCWFFFHSSCSFVVEEMRLFVPIDWSGIWFWLASSSESSLTYFPFPHISVKVVEWEAWLDSGIFFLWQSHKWFCVLLAVSLLGMLRFTSGLHGVRMTLPLHLPYQLFSSGWAVLTLIANIHYFIKGPTTIIFQFCHSFCIN